MRVKGGAHTPPHHRCIMITRPRHQSNNTHAGVVSVFSQAFPRVPHEEPHHPAGLPEDYHDLVSGTHALALALAVVCLLLLWTYGSLTPREQCLP